MTGSSGYVGLTGAVALAPLLVFGLWGGAIADTVDRRTLLLFTNAAIAVVSALFWLQALVDLHSVWVVLALLAISQALFAINMPTRIAAVARLVPIELVPSATALGATTMLWDGHGSVARGGVAPGDRTVHAVPAGFPGFWCARSSRCGGCLPCHHSTVCPVARACAM
jgi:Bacterial protein of unknown function (DUF894).